MQPGRTEKKNPNQLTDMYDICLCTCGRSPILGLTDLPALKLERSLT